MEQSKPVKQVRTRDEHGRWLPGTTGNGKGRPPTGAAIAESFRAYLSQEDPEAKGVDRKTHLIETLYRLATKNTDVSAARVILSYAYGNPKESVALETTEVPLEERQAAAFVEYLDGRPRTANSYRKYLLQQRRLSGDNGDED